MTPSTTSRNVKRSKLLRAVIPLAFWLGVWQLAAFLVDMRTNGHGALLLPYPLLVAQRLWTLAGQGAFWQSAADPYAIMPKQYLYLSTVTRIRGRNIIFVLRNRIVRHFRSDVF